MTTERLICEFLFASNNVCTQPAVSYNFSLCGKLHLIHVCLVVSDDTRVVEVRCTANTHYLSSIWNRGFPHQVLVENHL